MSTPKKQSTEAAVREIRRRTRRKFAPEEKIRIVVSGLRARANARPAWPALERITNRDQSHSSRFGIKSSAQIQEPRYAGDDGR